MHESENMPQHCDDLAYHRSFQETLHTPSARWSRDPGITSPYAKAEDQSIFFTPTQMKYHSLFYIYILHTILSLILLQKNYFSKNAYRRTLCQCKNSPHIFRNRITLLWINLSEELRFLPIYQKSLTMGQINLVAD